MKKQLLTIQGPRNAWVFSPGLISSLITLLLIPGFVYLGFWQISRGEEKQKIQSELETRINMPTLEVAEIMQEMSSKAKESSKSKVLENLRYRHLTVTGTFLNDKQILLDNQIVEGKVGYRVFTPLMTEQGKTSDEPITVLIDRGWIPMGQSRSEIPTIVAIEGEVTLSGMINQPSHGMILKGESLNEWPLRVQRIDYKILSGKLDQKLIPILVQLQNEDVYGFQIPPLSYKISVERHLGYAVQWFTLALATLIYYLVINSRTRSKHVQKCKQES